MMSDADPKSEEAVEREMLEEAVQQEADAQGDAPSEPEAPTEASEPAEVTEPVETDEAGTEEPSEEETPEPSKEPEPLTRPGMGWYVLRVASNKEEQVREALERKVRIEGLEDRIGRILVPMVKEKSIRRGQARVVQRKLYAGYVFVEMATEEDGSIPENVWFLVKETTGVGDFIQSDGRPTPMKEIEIERMLAAVTQTEEEASLSGIRFKPGDRVKIREGPFENFEGDVEAIDEQKGMVTVLLTIFGRESPVDVEYWNLESL